MRSQPIVRFLLCASAAALFPLVIRGAAPAPSAAPPAHTVVIKQMRFDPPQISVAVGDVIEWKNEDIFSHSVTANDGSFDSGLIDPGHSWTMTVTKAMDVGYHCRPHPNMTAMLRVGAAGDSSPQPAPSRPGEIPGVGLPGFSPPRSPQQLHPILVNFTAALLPLAFFSDLLGRLLRRQSLHDAAWWLIVYAAAITPLTVAAGWWWKHAAGPMLPPRLIAIHQWLGTTAAVLFVALALWRWHIRRRGVTPGVAYLACAFVAVLALVYQGSIGGMMAFGK